MTPDERPALSVVLVTWNAADFVAAALASLAVELARSPHEVIVVDNGSEDDTIGVVRRQAPRARVLANAGNRGFAAAANQGLRASRAAHVLFLNPDAELLPGAAAALVATLAAHPRVAIVGPQLLDPDGSPQVSYAAFRWPWERVWDHVWQAGRAARGARPTERAASASEVRATSLVPERPAAQRVLAVDWVIGACMLGRRRVLLDVGGFDEGYFMYAEDMDLCYRLSRRGHEVGFCPAARVRHRGNASGARYWRERREAAVIRSQLRFLRIHRGIAGDLGFRLLAVPFFLAKMAALGARAAMAPGPRAAEHYAGARRCLHMLQVLAGAGARLPRGSP